MYALLRLSEEYLPPLALDGGFRFIEHATAQNVHAERILLLEVEKQGFKTEKLVRRWRIIRSGFY